MGRKLLLGLGLSHGLSDWWENLTGKVNLGSKHLRRIMVQVHMQLRELGVLGLNCSTIGSLLGVARRSL